MSGRVESITTDWRGDTLAATVILGMTIVNVTTTSGSPNITSAVSAFTATDVGRAISGAGIPGGATVIAVNSGTSATMSANATASATINVTLGPPVLIAVSDTSDFDEDGGWLTIGGSAPLEYVSTDDDAAVPVVTLAAPLGVGVSYGAGEPVVVWDPTVPPFGAQVVEYVASVMTDRGPVAAVIPHAVIPTAGVENLVGASVGLDEDEDGEWFVSQVYGREAIIDPSSLGSPIFQATLTSDTPNVPTSTLTPIDDWVPNTYDTTDYSYNATTGELTLLREGLYDLVVYVKWTPATSGRRETSIMSYATSGGASKEEIVFTAAPSDNGTITQVVPLKYESNMTKGRPILRVEVWQNTGAGLSVRGSASENLTMWQVVRLR